MLGRDTKNLEGTSKCKFTFYRGGGGGGGEEFPIGFFGCTWEW